jgi:oligopeptide/dipeptide ABC transporter ATP-binding protein
LGAEDLLALPGDEMRHIRGNRISMIFQEPMTSLNPVYTVGQQIAEVFRIHRGLSRSEAALEAIRMLEQVAIPDAARRTQEYPFQLSGGMRQRVMIAMALACEPEVLIADEPTTALDVTIQAQILLLMKQLQEKIGTAIIFITHDLGVVAGVADDVAIMYAGRVVENGGVFEIFERPQHPYTRGLMDSIPSLEDRATEPLQIIEGMVPGLSQLPAGCRFHPRCAFADEGCRQTLPDLSESSPAHRVACFKRDQMTEYTRRHSG